MPYFQELATAYERKGVEQLDIFFDGKPTHKAKMQALFREQTCSLTIQVRFHFIAPYSPKLNLVEYAIHLIRQKVLHHADYTKNLSAFEADIQALCASGNILTKEQIINTLEHIEKLILKT